MQLHNDYLINGIGLRNGEFGHIVAIADELITAEFASGTFTVSMRYANLHWDYGYVTTIHKSQGGECASRHPATPANGRADRVMGDTFYGSHNNHYTLYVFSEKPYANNKTRKQVARCSGMKPLTVLRRH